jgi:glycerate-2-kinase
VLVLSDVLDDSLAVIGSGPCIPHIVDPLAIERILLDSNISQDDRELLSKSLYEYVRNHNAASHHQTHSSDWVTPKGCRVTHLTLGTNALAVKAASAASSALGYEIFSATTNTLSQTANTVGSRLATSLRTMVSLDTTNNYPQSLLEGGEATVHVPLEHGLGGRNQHTVVAAANDILVQQKREWPAGTLIASFGTDGEDGPTSAAGGFIDSDVAKSLACQPKSLTEAISKCDSHELLKSAGGLIETGPTGTNVADIRIVLTHPTSD